jgi:hypothetical protein
MYAAGLRKAERKTPPYDRAAIKVGTPAAILSEFYYSQLEFIERGSQI